MRSYEQIILHPRCRHAAEEMRLYAFKVDRLSGDILPEPLDRNNHLIDSLRYALQPMIKSGDADGYFQWIKSQAATETQAAAELAKRPGVIVTDLVSPWHRE